MIKQLSHLLTEFITDGDVLPELMISGICLDARLVQPGDVFFALQGHVTHGVHYAQQAIDGGASAIVYEDNSVSTDYVDHMVSMQKTATVWVPIKELGKKISAIAAKFYDNPSERMTVIAITGTNGKTTSSYLLAQMLEQMHVPSAIIGTLGSGPIANLEVTSLTTPDAISIQRRLAELLASGVTHVVMEASSHALHQDRLSAVQVKVAAFTNFTQDHLDYHGSMQNYLAAKSKLFAFTSLESVVLNSDDEVFASLSSLIASTVDVCTYSVKEVSIEAGLKHTAITINADGENFTVMSALLGDFNVANLLLCAAVMKCLGCNQKEVFSEAVNLVPPPGRLQRVECTQGPAVVIDYAHTPDALKNALLTLKNLGPNDLIAIFGCGGDRDKLKRPLMAKVAQRYADKVFLTNDNPRSENPKSIIDDVLAGFESPVNISVMPDRAEAIKEAILSANKNDIVLVAGKGHEKYQIIGEDTIEFDDYEHSCSALLQWREVA